MRGRCGRPPALARCPRTSVLCPFARGLRGLVSTTRAVSLGRPTTARASPYQVARGYSRSLPPRLLDRDAAARPHRAARGSERDSHKSQVPCVGVRARVGRICSAYKRKGIIFACIFHDSIRRWNF